MRRLAMPLVATGFLALLPSIALASSAAPALPDPEPCPGCWVPALQTSWQWQLQGPIDTSVDVDMFDVDGFEVPRGVVSDLHADGSAVVCYISAGSWERSARGVFRARGFVADQR